MGINNISRNHTFTFCKALGVRCGSICFFALPCWSGRFLNLVAVRILRPQWQLLFLKFERQRMMLNQSIDRSFDRKEVARAATNALRSIEFDNHAEAAAHVNVVTDAALWKVSEDTETSAIIENILDDVVPVVTANVPSGANLYAVSVNRANMRNGPSTRNGVIAKLERGTAVQLLPSSSGSWMKLHVVKTNRVGWISKKLLKKAD